MAAAAASVDNGFVPMEGNEEFKTREGAAFPSEYVPMEPGFLAENQPPAAEAMEMGGLAEETAVPPVVTPCQWNDLQPCTVCRQTRCATCAVGLPCESCSEDLPKMCFAYCELNPDLCAGLKGIDPSLWQEMYAAVRCLRDRRDPDLTGKAERERMAHIETVYPGFCRQHNTGDYERFVDQYWRRLPWPYQLLLNYMIDGSRCGLMNYEKFLQENARVFQGITFFDVLQHALLVPAGLIGVDPIYLQAHIQYVIDTQRTLNVLDDPALRQRMQAPDFTEAEANDWIVRKGAEFQTARHTYNFLVDGLLQQSTLSWLLDQNACLRTLNWNLAFYKVFLAVLRGFLPVNVRNCIPAFHSNWKKVWNTAAASVEAQLTNEEVRRIFTFHWNDFMANMDQLVLMIDDIMKEVPVPDPRPELDLRTVLTELQTCPASKN